LRKLTLLQLVAATYMMVAGGPFGLEDIVQKAGYLGAVVVLIVTPLVWSLPTVLMVSELSSAIPEEGGYYTWVKRAMGRFWGFQEAWLSLAASVFDMAIYPTLFTLYLGRLWPNLGTGTAAFLIGSAVIALCVAWNTSGARSVGSGSVLMTIAMLAPFAVLAGTALLHASTAAPPPVQPVAFDLLGGILVAMWNYMGWDNATTFAGEVKRPQRTYPLAMMTASALVALTYVLPVLAVSRTGIEHGSWSTGSWVDVAGVVVGQWLAVAVVCGGMISGIGLFNALMLSYSRIPAVLAEDGFLPKIFARRQATTGAPWMAILACGVAWAACLTLGFERLIALDVLLYGLSLLLEFGALVVLRVREPNLARPFCEPGGLFGAVIVGIGPLALLGAALWREHDERIGSLHALTFAAIIIAAGGLVYAVSAALARRHWRRHILAHSGCRRPGHHI